MSLKKQLMEEDKLDKFRRTNENKSYKDISASKETNNVEDLAGQLPVVKRKYSGSSDSSNSDDLTTPSVVTPSGSKKKHMKQEEVGETSHKKKHKKASTDCD
ncbi:hypothetical protein NP493_805g02001 [Ridgeia piscesae]|uniref:Uncharacterized protein n=1 Tax=Ridgeia piscesae TaxID=27915 RepID=A0AAD9KN21_RIDPI|nr:hypothetical protein NP493_805g02001 [Ridgeia piscesae]